MFFSYALGAVILILVLLRQVRVRPVPRIFQPRLPIVIGVIGLIEMFSYSGDHHVSGTAWGWVIGTLVIGALGLGALRGLSMRVWAADGWVLRQGNALTMGLWLVSLLVHFAGDAGGDHAGAAGLVGASFLLYLGVTLAAQYYVVYRRALPLWAQLGPERRPTPPSELHPGTRHLLCDLPLARRRSWCSGRLGGHRGPGPRRTATRPSSTRRSSRTTTAAGRPNCRRLTDRSYTRRP